MKHFSEITASAERVVDATEQLVQRFGYNGFSYDDVAQKVGIKKPSIHHHFPTKGELVAVVAQRYSHRFSDHLQRIEREHVSAKARLHAYAMLFEDTYLQDRRLCVCGMLGTEASDLPPEVAQEVETFFKLNLSWLAHVISAPPRPAKSPMLQAEAKSRAMTLLCALEGAMVVGRGLRSDVGPIAVVDSLISLLLA
jgi:TetR/AcrR family transcriptional regulator, transcriptional repressor for nem operon